MTVLDRPAAASVLALIGAVLGTALAAVLFAAGWTAGKLVVAAQWSATAVRLGFDDARRPGGG